MNALIVEDSRLARVELRALLQAYPEVTIIGEATHVDEALAFLAKQSVDLLFLDINMPGKNGFALLEALDEVPPVIFTTAYDAYAIQAFEVNALDYLLKPIEPARLAAALERVATPTTTNVPIDLPHQSRLFVKDGERCWLLQLQEIQHVESVGNYTRLHFKGQQALLHKSLAQLEARLPPTEFFRANRQVIFQINMVTAIEPWFSGSLRVTLVDGTVVELSRRQATKWKQLLSW